MAPRGRALAIALLSLSLGVQAQWENDALGPRVYYDGETAIPIPRTMYPGKPSLEFVYSFSTAVQAEVGMVINLTHAYLPYKVLTAEYARHDSVKGVSEAGVVRMNWFPTPASLFPDTWVAFAEKKHVLSYEGEMNNRSAAAAAEAYAAQTPTDKYVATARSPERNAAVDEAAIYIAGQLTPGGYDIGVIEKLRSYSTAPGVEERIAQLHAQSRWDTLKATAAGQAAKAKVQESLKSANNCFHFEKVEGMEIGLSLDEGATLPLNRQFVVYRGEVNFLPNRWFHILVGILTVEVNPSTGALEFFFAASTMEYFPDPEVSQEGYLAAGFWVSPPDYALDIVAAGYDVEGRARSGYEDYGERTLLRQATARYKAIPADYESLYAETTWLCAAATGAGEGLYSAIAPHLAGMFGNLSSAAGDDGASASGRRRLTSDGGVANTGYGNHNKTYVVSTFTQLQTTMVGVATVCGNVYVRSDYMRNMYDPLEAAVWYHFLLEANKDSPAMFWELITQRVWDNNVLVPLDSEVNGGLLDRLNQVAEIVMRLGGVEGMGLTQRLAKFQSALPQVLYGCVSQLPHLLEPPRGNARAQHAYVLSQLATLAYSDMLSYPLNAATTSGAATGSIAGGYVQLTGVDNDCEKYDVVRCSQEELEYREPDVYGSNFLKAPTYCLFKSASELVLSFRGTVNLDDAETDLLGFTWLDEAPSAIPASMLNPNATGTSSTAPVHAGFWRSWSASGAAEVIADLLRAQPSHLPLYVTGHSLGAAIASVAAHDLSLAILNGSIPYRDVELTCFAKPAVGGVAWAASYEWLLNNVTNTPLKYAKYYATATAWASDMVVNSAIGARGTGAILLEPASADPATWVWVHEVEGFRLPCCDIGEGPCDAEAIANRSNLIVCHISAIYQSQARIAAADYVPAASSKLADCQVASADLPSWAQYKGLCGTSKHVAYPSGVFNDPRSYNKWCYEVSLETGPFADYVPWLILSMIVILGLHIVVVILTSYALRLADGKSVADFRAVVLDGNYAWAANPIYNFQSSSTVFGYLNEATTPELLQEYDETLSLGGYRRRRVTGDSSEVKEGQKIKESVYPSQRYTSTGASGLNVVSAAAAPIASTELASISATSASPPPSPPPELGETSRPTEMSSKTEPSSHPGGSPSKSPERAITKREFRNASKRAVAAAKTAAEGHPFTGRHRQAKLFGYSVALGILATALAIIPRIPIYYTASPQGYTWFDRRGGMEVFLWVALFLSCTAFTFLNGQRAYFYTNVNSVAYKVTQGLIAMQYKGAALTPSHVLKTVRNSMHGTKPKRSPLVFGLASTLGIFFIPAALVHLGNMPSRYPDTANLHVFYVTEAILTLMAPGLPHVIRAFGDFYAYWRPVEGGLLMAGHMYSLLAGGPAALVGLLYLSAWHSLLFVGNNALVSRGWIVVSLVLAVVQVVIFDHEWFSHAGSDVLVTSVAQFDATLSEWVFWMVYFAVTAAIGALMCLLFQGSGVLTLNPYLSQYISPLAYLESLAKGAPISDRERSNDAFERGMGYVGSRRANQFVRMPFLLSAAQATSLLISVTLVLGTGYSLGTGSLYEAALSGLLRDVRRLQQDWLGEYFLFVPLAKELWVGFLIPGLQLMIDFQRVLQWALFLGSLGGLVVVVLGQRDLRRLYPYVYERLAREGPSAMPFDLSRANGHTYLGLSTAWNIAGLLILLGVCAVVAVVLAVWVIPGPFAGPVRNLIEVSIFTTLTDSLILRACVLPIAMKYELGVVMYALELYFIVVCFIKGVARLGWHTYYFVFSFFYPHRCAFPTGNEATDLAHVAFASVVMMQVELDQKIAEAALEPWTITAAKDHVDLSAVPTAGEIANPASVLEPRHPKWHAMVTQIVDGTGIENGVNGTLAEPIGEEDLEEDNEEEVLEGLEDEQPKQVSAA